MYGIYTNIWGLLMVNVTMYSIHGSYGIDFQRFYRVPQAAAIHHPKTAPGHCRISLVHLGEPRVSDKRSPRIFLLWEFTIVMEVPSGYD